MLEMKLKLAIAIKELQELKVANAGLMLQKDHSQFELDCMKAAE